MKKILYALLLLNQIALYGMEDGIKSILNDAGLSTMEQINQYVSKINLPEAMDSAIKEDISFNDPQAFEKMARYSDLFLSEFKHYVGNPKTTPQESDTLRDIVKMLGKFQEDVKCMQNNVSAQKESDTVSSLIQAMKQRRNQQSIAVWNVFKTTSLVMLNVMKKREQQDTTNS